ncbi:hypothetical protein G6N05_15435 [Flavobacterium sp. F372]|uniref:Uncharacterized protein n=2 Tax=Flavobacterium bernardetii TaxID=2813823 RepID=A0ABR7J2S6_9FLAO|nr:hypothetical protein [Flavobacterium bernardetii]NHF71503.1 hypothetical protein [Flavobacterium bernardetii]
MKMKNKYILKLDKIRIGYTEFEYADVPMGVIHGKIIFENINSPFELFQTHCTKFNVEMNDNDISLRLIDTVVIPQLKVYTENNEELKGWGGAITGMDSDEFEILFGGITSEIMQKEFGSHFKEYYGEK